MKNGKFLKNSNHQPRVKKEQFHSESDLWYLDEEMGVN